MRRVSQRSYKHNRCYCGTHTHLGKPGENGPIELTFFKYDTPRNNVSETGSITADMLEGPLKGKPLSDLALSGANGSLYVNIHTEKNPNGEIRGQVAGSFVCNSLFHNCH